MPVGLPGCSNAWLTSSAPILSVLALSQAHSASSLPKPAHSAGLLPASKLWTPGRLVQSVCCLRCTKWQCNRPTCSLEHHLPGRLACSAASQLSQQQLGCQQEGQPPGRHGPKSPVGLGNQSASMVPMQCKQTVQCKLVFTACTISLQSCTSAHNAGSNSLPLAVKNSLQSCEPSGPCIRSLFQASCRKQQHPLHRKLAKHPGD